MKRLFLLAIALPLLAFVPPSIARERMEPENWIQGNGYSGACVSEPNVNIRGEASLDSPVTFTTDSKKYSMRVFDSKLTDDGLWAIGFIDVGDRREVGWVNARFLNDCSDPVGSW